MARLEKLQGTPQSISEATRAQWVTDNPLKWLYHRSNPALTKLELDPTQAGLPQELISLLEGMDTALKQDSTVLCQFKALRALSEKMRGKSVAFKISVALRGPAAATLHQGFAARDGCMALQLIGANLHRERQRQCKANLARQCVFGRPSSTKLLNPPGANACYINSTILSLLHTCHSVQDTDVLLGRMAAIRQVVQQSRRPLLMMTFRNLLREWRAPTQQHDIGEFFQFLTHASAMGLQHHAWRNDEGSNSACLTQDILEHPSHLTSPLQGVYLTNRTQCRIVSSITFGDKLHLWPSPQRLLSYACSSNDSDSRNTPGKIPKPSFGSRESLRCQFGIRTRGSVRYQITAIAVHQGDTPQSGHYQTCLIDNSHEYLTNDNIAAKQLRHCDRHMVNCNSYLLFCARVD